MAVAISVGFGAVLYFVAEDLLSYEQRELFEAVTSILAVVREGLETALLFFAAARGAASTAMPLLILVAAGVLTYGVHDLQEANVLPGVNTLAFDLSATFDSSSWHGAVLAGAFNITVAPSILEAVCLGRLRRTRAGALPVARRRSASRIHEAGLLIERNEFRYSAS